MLCICYMGYGVQGRPTLNVSLETLPGYTETGKGLTSMLERASLESNHNSNDKTVERIRWLFAIIAAISYLALTGGCIAFALVAKNPLPLGGLIALLHPIIRYFFPKNTREG